MNVQVRKNSSLAVVALVAGVLGWTLVPFLGSLVAIITGHMARSEIRRSAGLLDGDGMALVGLVLGYVMIGLTIGGILIMVLFFGGLAWLSTLN